MYMYMYVPAVEQGRSFPQVFLQVGTGSRHDTLSSPSEINNSEMGVAPHGHIVTLEGRSAHEGHAPL